MKDGRLPPYKASLAGKLLAAREAVMDPIRPFLRQANVTEQQWRVLRVLSDEGELDPSTLAHYAILHAPSVTRILRELAERGALVREADTMDGRRSVLRLTTSGRELVDRTANHTSEILRKYTARFGQERLDALLSELTELQRAVATLVDEDENLDGPATSRVRGRRI